MAHAFLPASGAYIWTVCSLQPHYTKDLKDRAGDPAKQGTLAHAISEWTLRGILGMNSSKFVKAELKKLKATKYDGGPNHGKDMYDAEMSRHVSRYVAYIMEQYAEALRIDPNAKIFLEREFDLSRYIPEGFGTADVSIIANRIFRGFDLKYGKHKLIEAKDNKQLKIYAVGAAVEFDAEFDFDFFEMTIYQPRLDHIDTMEISRQELLDWAKYYLRPKAAIAWKGEGELVAGNHCGFCKAIAICPAVKEKAMIAAKYKFAAHKYLPDEAVVESYLYADLQSAWNTQVKKYALEEALERGKKWPGLILTNGRAVRKYKDERSVAERLRGLEYSEDQFYKKSIIGIGEMEKLLGGQFDEILKGLVERPPGAPTLVIDDGKRDKYSKIKNKFKNIE